MVAGLRNVQDRQGRGGLARGEEQRRRSTFERGNPLLNDILRGVLDAGVNVAELRKREQARYVIRAVEHINDDLIDRRCARVGDGVWLGAGVNLLGFELPVC